MDDARESGKSLLSAQLDDGDHGICVCIFPLHVSRVLPSSHVTFQQYMVMHNWLLISFSL